MRTRKDIDADIVAAVCRIHAMTPVGFIHGLPDVSAYELDRLCDERACADAARPTPAESPAIAAAERAVLDACAELDLRQHRTGMWTCYGGQRDVELAELARRAAARGTEGDRG